MREGEVEWGEDEGEEEGGWEEGELVVKERKD